VLLEIVDALVGLVMLVVAAGWVEEDCSALGPQAATAKSIPTSDVQYRMTHTPDAGRSLVWATRMR
jgi:hypothetical protein